MFKDRIQFLLSYGSENINIKMRNAFKWSFIGQLSSRLINLVSTIILARIMLPEQFGIYIYIISSLIFFSQILSLSVRSTNTRNVAFLLSSDKIKARKFIFISLVLGVSFAFIGCVFLLLLTFTSKDNIIISEYSFIILALSVASIIPEIISASVVGILEGFKSFKHLNVATVFISALKLVFSYCGFQFYGIDGAITGWVMSSFIGVFIFSKFLIQGLKANNIVLRGIDISECKEELKLFFNFSIPSSLEGGSLLLVMWLIQSVIMGYGDMGKKEIALFNIASQWKHMIVYLPAILINMLQSFLSGLNGEGKKNSAEALFRKTKKFITSISVFLIMIFIATGKIILKLYGENYDDAYFVLVVLILPVVFININALNRQYLISLGRVWVITINNMIAGLLIIGLFIILIKIKALSLSLSFAISLGIGEVLMFIIYWIMLSKISTPKRMKSILT